MELIIALIVLLLYAIIFWGIFDKVSICENSEWQEKELKEKRGQKLREQSH